MISTVLLLLQVGAAFPPAPSTLEVRSGSAGKSVALLRTEAGPAVQVEQLAPVIPVRVTSGVRGRWTLSVAGIEVAVRDQVPFVMVGGTLHQLAGAPFVNGGSVHVPLQLLADLLPKAAPERFRYDSERGELRLLGAAGGQVAAASTQRDSERTAAASPTSAGETTAPPAAAKASTAAPRNGPNRPLRVVIDAGHGGQQTGMSGPIGPGPRIREKDITLAVALEVERILRRRGVHVVMIRQTDVDIDFRDRGRMANEAGGDLFISIHVNAANPRWRNASAARGFETYFLAAARTEDEQRVAAMENAAMGFEAGAEFDANDPLGFLMRDMAQNAHLRESSHLAEMIQGHLAKTHPGPNRGVKQAPFAVLVGAFMPSVLVELGFGTNPAEARYMASAAGQRQLAAAIADAAVEYLDYYSRRLGSTVQ